MKKMTMAAAVLLVCASCSLSETYQVKGALDGVENGASVELVGLNAEGEDTVLVSGMIDNGTFQMSISTDVAEMACLRLPNAKLRIPVFFEPGVQAYELTDGTVKGGQLQEQWNRYYRLYSRFLTQKDSIEAIYKKATEADDLFAKMHERAVYEELKQIQENKEDSLLKANDNIVSATIVWMRAEELVGKRKLGDKVALLGQQALQTGAGKAVKRVAENIDQMEKEQIAPDFTQNDPEGKPVSLYAVNAKVKVLDFWASWCGPCRAETPNVRRVYEKYKNDGLEIISVSLDTKKENWLKAIEKDGMNWIHTSDLKGWNNAVAKRYGVNSVPAIFLLDGNNRIIARNLRGEVLEEAIRKALGK